MSTADKRRLTDRPTYMQPLGMARLRRWWWKRARRWPGETCQRCGRAYGRGRGGALWSVWRASDMAWACVIGSHEGGRYCVPCFVWAGAVTGHTAYITVELDNFGGTSCPRYRECYTPDENTVEAAEDTP